MAGYDPRDPSSMRDAVPDFTSAVGRDIGGLKLGWSLGWGYAAVDPDVAVAAEAGAKVFEELGCTVDESDIALNAPFDTWYVLSTSSAIAVNGHLPEDQLTWYVNYGLEHGRKLSVVDYGRALGERDVMIQQFWDQFDKFDLLLSRQRWRQPHFEHEQYPEEIGGEPATCIPWWGYLPHTHPINTIGFTAASVPCGFDSDGMPVGLHIVGKARR